MIRLGGHSARFAGCGAAAAWRGVGSIMLGVAACVLLSGCASAPKRSFVPDRDPDSLSATAFLHYLPTVPVASVDEGCRAVLVLTGDEGEFADFALRKAELVRRGAFQKSWRLGPDNILDRGTLAFMLRVVCEVPPCFSEVAVMPHGVGRRRYALRNCVREGLMPYGLAYEPVSGGELLGAIWKAEAYLESRKPKAP